MFELPPDSEYAKKMALWKSLLKTENDPKKIAMIQSWIRTSEEQLELEACVLAEFLIDIYEWRWKNNKLGEKWDRPGSNPPGSKKS